MNHRQPMESRMRGNAHVRFGGRPEEPERPKARHRPSGPPNHIVALATDALDEIRREVWNEARRAGQTQLARDLKGARFALWTNPENLTARRSGCRVGGRRQRRAAWPTGAGFLPPPPRTVR